jgi:hypothetical protein
VIFVKLSQEVKNVAVKIPVFKVVIFVKLIQELKNAVNFSPIINRVMSAP